MTASIQVEDQRFLGIDNRRKNLILNNENEVVFIDLYEFSATATFYAADAENFDQSDIFFSDSLFYTLFDDTRRNRALMVLTFQPPAMRLSECAFNKSEYEILG